MISFWFLPSHLRIASERAYTLLRCIRFDVLYLNVTRKVEGLIYSLAEGAPYDWFIHEVVERGLVPEPAGSWEYWVKPILLAIRGILKENPRVKIFCYRQPYMAEFSARLAIEIARLTFRFISTGKTDLGKWRCLISHFLRVGGDAMRDEARYIMDRYEPEERGVCISDLGSRGLIDLLRDGGLELDSHYILLPYHFTPIEIITREIRRYKMRGLTMPDQRLLRLIREHTKFIRDYILLSRDYDEAYLRWIHDRARWIESRLKTKLYTQAWVETHSAS